MFHFPKHLPATALLDCSFPCRWAGKAQKFRTNPGRSPERCHHRGSGSLAHVHDSKHHTLISMWVVPQRKESCRLPLYSSWHSAVHMIPGWKPINNFSLVYIQYHCQWDVFCWLFLNLKQRGKEYNQSVWFEVLQAETFFFLWFFFLKTQGKKSIRFQSWVTLTSLQWRDG